MSQQQLGENSVLSVQTGFFFTTFNILWPKFIGLLTEKPSTRSLGKVYEWYKSLDEKTMMIERKHFRGK
jgi:hypothetical protein